jgi:antitoxin VapB
MQYETLDILCEDDKQMILLPDNMKFSDKKVYLKRVGNSLYMIPFNDPWQNLIDSVNFFTEDYMETRENSINDIRESFDL